ncbi:MAG: SDR family NAD(P)-dependent oxidoreductase [Rhodospirillales bacterium]|jgi:NAD(P)-dependent dehydrogenase (short-subunit alcohol dehydrogenase family)|nr:oxidoreductase [Rhodospirillaceae bacterium]MDP6426837.1 SDR family NAD(P)-dependent oxidoreductase [Rhodospirillales bacterium]
MADQTETGTGETKNGLLSGRIALVTGASRGIGAAIAKRIAAEGAHAILIARTQGGLEEVDDEIRAAGGTATLTPLDLSELDKIDQLGAALFERFGKLDIVIGAAGLLGTMGPITHLEPKVWDDVMTVNLTANWRMIRSFDPLLRQSDAGRALYFTSTAARAPRAYWSVYAVSKAALEMTVGIYAKETQKTAIRVNLFDPGRTRTVMRAEAVPGEDPDTLKSPEFVAEQVIELVSPSCTKHGEIIKALEPDEA